VYSGRLLSSAAVAKRACGQFRQEEPRSYSRSEYGANDVSMIHAAHAGVGISGVEGPSGTLGRHRDLAVSLSDGV